jgi:hypothetical protein
MGYEVSDLVEAFKDGGYSAKEFKSHSVVLKATGS